MGKKYIINSLDSVKLYYEELEKKKVAKPKKSKVLTNEKKTSKPAVQLKQRIVALTKKVNSYFDNVLSKVLHRKKAKKLTKAEQKLARQQQMRGIIGIGLLFVVVSIAYSTYMTVLFVDGAAMVVALTPQVVFASAILLIAFYKIYK